MDNYEIYYRMQERFRDEDIQSVMAQMIEDGEIPKDAEAPSADALEDALGKNDAYWDAYWATVRFVIEEINGR